MYPLAAVDDPMLSALREAHEVKSREAAERWRASTPSASV